jgi:hypothetical protein
MTSRLVGALVLIGAATARGQSIRGEVRDETTKQPIVRVTVSLLDAKDSTIRNVLSNDSGRFAVALPGPGTYSLSLRRVGWAKLMTKPFTVRANDTVSTLTFEMARQIVALDTVVSVETRGVFAMTPGKEYVRKHFALGLGAIISGWEIEKTGLSLSAYLGQQAGLLLTQAWPRPPNGPPMVPVSEGIGLISQVSTQCLYARVDRFSILYLLITEAAESLDELIKVKDIMAVEVYLDHREVPDEWKQDAWVSELFQRLNGSRPYLIGHTGTPSISAETLAEEAPRFATARMAAPGARGSATIPPCGFLQIWTSRAW